MDYKSLHELLKKVNKAFYDRIYKDPWLKDVFRDVPQEKIEAQQSDFMLGALGGPEVYAGRNPRDAHPHIFVDEEMWALREKYLVEALNEVGAPADLKEKWLKIDNAFKKSILKRSPADCKGRFVTDDLIIIPNPNKKKAA